MATSSAGFIFKLLGVKKGLFISFGIASTGMLLICVWGYNATNEHGQTWTLPILVMISKFGISAAFNLVYLGNGVLFPTLFTATSMGLCNIFARTASIASPFIAEIPGVTPMYIALAISAMTLVAVGFIQKPVDM